MEPRLGRVFARFRTGLGALLHPPGASAYVALTVAVAGWETGLNAPFAVGETLAVRTLFHSGPEAFAATVLALPDPSRPAITSALLLLIMVLFGLGGWIGVALALDRPEPPAPRDWLYGLARSGRALFWWGTLGGALLGVLALGALMALVAFRMALRGQLDGYLSYVLPGAASGGFFLMLIAGLYALSVTVFMGIVAIAEPEVSWWSIPARGHQVFMQGHGERLFRHLAWILPGWHVLKLGLMQLAVPFKPLTGRWLDVFATGGALLQGLLTAGDALILLFALVLAVEIYRVGALKRATPVAASE